MEEISREKIWTKSFISISLIQFLYFTVFYTLLTTLPIFVIEDLQESESKAGLVVTFMLLSAILTRPFSAKVIDIIGQKKTLVFMVFFFFITTITYIFINNFLVLSIVRFIHGISFGFLTTVTGAIAANIVPLSRRGEGMGYFAMAMNIAVVFGPFIGLFLIQHVSFKTLFIVLSIFMLFGLIFSILVETKEEQVKQETPKLTITWSDLIEVKVLPITFIVSLIGVAYGSILSFVPVYAETVGLANYASYFFLIFALVMIVSRPYLGRAFDEKGARVVLLPSLFVFAVGLMMLSQMKTVLLFLLAAAVIGLGYGTILPGFQTLSVQQAGPKRTSQAMSTFFTLYDIGIGIGAFIWGLISSQYGFPLMYLISGFIVLLAFLMFALYTKNSIKTD